MSPPRCLIALLLPLSVGAAPRLVVKPTPDMQVWTGAGQTEATELWLEDYATGSRRMLLRGHDAPDAKNIVAEITSPVLSLDGDYAYFVSAAFATSDAIHRLNLRDGTETFLIDGDTLAIIPTGPRRGLLLVDRALIKLDASGESLGRAKYLWLVSPEGRPLREIGPTEEPATEQIRLRLLTPQD